MKGIGAAAFPLALVALLTALTFWLERAVNPEDPAHKALKRHDPDYIVSQIEARHFDTTGALKQSMLAESITHYPDDDSSLIAKPQLTYYLESGSTKLLANTAQITRDNKQVFLRGDVHLIKPPRPDHGAIVMQTEAMTVFPDEDIAQSDVRVTISQEESVVSGDSIHYNGRTSIAILTGRIKGTFHRTKKS